MVNIVHNLLANYSLSCSTSISLEEWRFPSGPGAFPNSLATHQSWERSPRLSGVFGANQVNDHLPAQGTWQEPITALTASSRPQRACWESRVQKHCFGASSLTPCEPLRISADLSLSPPDSEEFTGKRQSSMRIPGGWWLKLRFSPIPVDWTDAPAVPEKRFQLR